MENSIVDLLSELVRINSVNLTLSHGPGENEIATFIRHRLDELALEPKFKPSHLTGTMSSPWFQAPIPGNPCC